MSRGPACHATITDAQVEEVVVRTLEEVPEGATHWSKRELAKRVGISPTSVHRIWRAFGLKPWLVEDFTVSPDPFLIDKVRDVVGLYLAPPADAAVFSVDEKPRSRPWSGPRRCCRWCRASPSAAAATTTARHDRPVRGAEHRHRQGDRQTVGPAHGPRTSRSSSPRSTVRSSRAWRSI